MSTIQCITIIMNNKYVKMINFCHVEKDTWLQL